MPLYIEKINGDANRPTDQQGEYRAICLFRKLENRKKAEICKYERRKQPFPTFFASPPFFSRVTCIYISEYCLNLMYIFDSIIYPCFILVILYTCSVKLMCVFQLLYMEVSVPLLSVEILINL